VPSHDQYGKHIDIGGLEQGWRGNIFERIQKIFGYPLKK
jgi:hypothetical protein